MNLDGLKDIFKSFVKTMLAKAIELFFINQMMNAIFGGVSGYVPLPQMNLSGRASGGNVNSNQPYLVGERGPELFVPSSAGNVMNNANTKSIGGGGAVVNQTINVNAGVSQTVRAEMLNLLPSIKQDTLNAVIDSKNRGGSFSKAFA
jgi:SLT domain-containing protein